MRNLMQLLTLASMLFLSAMAASVNTGGSKRKVAYWSAYDAGIVPGGDDFSQLDGLTHLILFAVDMRNIIDKVDVSEKPLEMVEKMKVIENAARAKSPPIKIMGAFGGWAQDQRFITATATKEGAVKLGNEIAEYALARKWDGIDLDHEYPTPANTYWADMIEAIKLKAPDTILSLAMPGKPKTEPLASDPKTQVMSGYTKALMTRIAPKVDFYNLMTYDMVNRYSDEAYHHSSFDRMLLTIADLELLGVKKQQMNIGFAYYAKWFPSPSCDIPSGLGCKFNPLTEINSGAFRYDTSHNGNWGGEMGKIPEELWTKATTSFTNNILTEAATGAGPHYDKDKMADAMYDTTSGLFWTWQSPHAIKETCEALKKIPDLGGQFVFSLGQDRTELAHHTAWTKCVADWK